MQFVKKLPGLEETCKNKGQPHAAPYIIWWKLDIELYNYLWLQLYIAIAIAVYLVSSDSNEVCLHPCFLLWGVQWMVCDWEQIQSIKYAGSHLGNRTQDREDYSESDEDRREATRRAQLK